jgi:biotin carboxyl carrier protein
MYKNDLYFIKQIIDIIDVNHIKVFQYKLAGGRGILIKKFSSREGKITRGDLNNDDNKNGGEVEKSTFLNIKTEGNFKMVESPLTGVFYSSPSPESKPFVKVGDDVSKDSSLCIIEAMKIMNKVKSSYTGTVSEVLVKDGCLVEFGQPLFKIKLS